MEPDALSARWDSSRLSLSSFPRQGWPRLSPSYAPPSGDAGPSHHASWRHYDPSAEDESLLAHRSSTLRQLHGDSRPWSRQDRSANPTSTRPSTLPTQPVLVRAYSENADEPTGKPSSMSPRRLFPFTGSRGSFCPRPSGPTLPSDKDFSIDSILQAIDPDICGTLDSIAEICGRSKLSLANEYGSHIAPLGEIRAPPGGLVPVEEASSSDERHADEGVVIFDDDPGTLDTGRDMHPFSFYRYLETLRHAASALERNGASTSLMAIQANAAQSAITKSQLDTAVEMERAALPITREFFSGPKNSGRDLLGKHKLSGRTDQSLEDIATPALVSEVHLYARAGEQHSAAEPRFPARAHNPHGSQTSDGWNTSDVVQSLLGWLKWTTRVVEPDSRPALQSAEDRLRAMLERSADEHISLPAA
ncbi:uncharacterized protein N7482_002689 [Penicillium canariense]|uniref:Uncharacterized protein n=1 Tax=Penicillium canariense TaxID=189055 RepID=A0A9W9II09_9EURO|nr:uncharacterized protein N7482_002689 [Penicillium canariense]KAJ5176812.1 hypothetical protein N7482_002689 [Penicillium canariense]